MTISCMRRHAPFGQTDPNLLHVGWGHGRNQLCEIFLKIGSGVLELEDLEIWHFPLKAFIALTTVLRGSAAR